MWNLSVTVLHGNDPPAGDGCHSDIRKVRTETAEDGSGRISDETDDASRSKPVIMAVLTRYEADHDVGSDASESHIRKVK